jgi:hypothetical protein
MYWDLVDGPQFFGANMHERRDYRAMTLGVSLWESATVLGLVVHCLTWT